MAKESEKRFEAVMEKLFKTPQKSKPNHSSPIITSNTSGVQSSRGRKRPNVSSAMAILGPMSRSSAVNELHTASGSSGSVHAPPCRPWDRSDLYRRLATFKSMTWFAKPQAVSAVNCARRGWINVDMDIIACESCGARLLFSTPSSWTQQQVEKAALVFSLKLDSGHKLLCPWVDNTCDEALAQFPPKPTAGLVEDYKNRFSVLLQLSALPAISSLSVACIRSPHLEEFLKGSSCLENNGHTDSGKNLIYSYYQAQKLISLFGWEPRSLPYFVDYKRQKEQSTENANLMNPSSRASNGCDLSVFRSCHNGNKQADSGRKVSTFSDPNSFVLYCSLCSATVGLWTFSSVLRPVEYLRLVGYTEINGKSESDQPEDENPDINFQGAITNFAAPSSAHERSSLNLTIAGGPSPANQNYRATISLPVVGRSLRARFFTDPPVGKDQDLPLAEADVAQQGTNQIGEQDSNMENSAQGMQAIAQDSSKDDKLDTDDAMMKSYSAQHGEQIGSSAEDDVVSNVNDKAREISTATFVETAHDKQRNRLHDSGIEARVQLETSNSDNLGKSSQQALLPQPMEFDPIKQHRFFCPWITSTTQSAPGWQQTLSALQHHKELSQPWPENASSVIEVDDPIASVKRLFSSRPEKREKHGSASNA